MGCNHAYCYRYPLGGAIMTNTKTKTSKTSKTADKKENKGKYKEVYVVIPAFNEEQTISKVIQDLKNHQFHNIIVVDDHSKDNTFLKSQAHPHPVQVLHHIANRGQGAALKTGIDFALQQGAQKIITFDSDGQHQAKDLAAMLTPLEEGTHDIVIGSRFIGEQKSNIPWFRKLILKGGLVFLFVMYGLRLSDAQNGLRIMNRHAATAIEMKEDRMEHATEILHEIKKKSLRFKEVPVDIRYTDYSKMKGQSSLNSIKIAFNLMMRRLTK